MLETRERVRIEGLAEGIFSGFSKWPKSKMATALRLAERPVGRFCGNRQSDRLGSGCKSKGESRGIFIDLQNGRNPRRRPTFGRSECSAADQSATGDRIGSAFGASKRGRFPLSEPTVTFRLGAFLFSLHFYWFFPPKNDLAHGSVIQTETPLKLPAGWFSDVSSPPGKCIRREEGWW